MVEFLTPKDSKVQSWLSAHADATSITGHRPDKFPRREHTNLEPLTEGFKARNPRWARYDPFGLYEPNGEVAALAFARDMLVKYQAQAVIAGGAMGADMLFTEAAIELGLPLMLAVPFEEQDRIWPNNIRSRWRSQLERADLVVCVTPTSAIRSGYDHKDVDLELMRKAMADRNMFMMQSGTAPVMAFWDGSSGGTGNAVRQCRTLDRKLINVHPEFLARFVVRGTASQPIEGFIGEYRWLSNYTPGAPIKMSGLTYPTVETAYQAAKTTDPALREPFTRMRPSEAKQAGKTLPLRPDWDSIKIDVMLALVRTKFRDPALRARLIDTGSSPLVETNHWGDEFWGVCRGKGKNHLGKILMQVREEARNS